MAVGIFDIHSHVLPGLDDGSSNWDMTLEMLRTSWESGVRAIFATPHYLPWRNSYKAKDVPGLCKEAEKRLKDTHGIVLPIYPGQELYYHSDILKDLEAGKAIPMAGSRRVLVEFDEDAPYSQIKNAVGQLRSGGYKILIAHCERYTALRDPAHLEQLLQMNAKLQSNAEEMQKGFMSRTKQWLKKRYAAEEILYLGSDMHDLTSRPPITPEALKWFEKHIPEGTYRKQLFWGNAFALTQK